MPSATEFILFYDPICPLCTRTVERLRHHGLLERAEARPIDDGPALGLSADEADGARSEMMLRSRVSGATLRGFDAFVRLLELHARMKPLTLASALPPVRSLGRAVYRLIALNRRILSPPATRGVACACDPPYRPAWRAALFAVLSLAASGGFFLHGLLLGAVQGGRPAPQAGLEVMAAAWSAWLAAQVAFLALLPRRYRQIFWQSLVAMAIGTAVLLPFSAVTSALAGLGVTQRGNGAWGLLAMASAWGTMLLATIHRHHNLGLPRWTPWAWLAASAAGAAPWVFVWRLAGIYTGSG